MTPITVFNIQIAFGLVVFGLLVKWYLYPRVAAASRAEALVPFLFLSTLRYVGLVFLVPGAAQNLPTAFSVPAAWLDFVAASLALVALVFVKKRLSGAIVMAWIFVLATMVDQGVNFVRANQLGVFDSLGSLWLLPTLFAPAVIISLFMVIWVLIRHRD